MIEAFVGLVGGGKTFSSVKRLCNYMASGGVVVSNILLSGYDVDSASFAADSPVLNYLRDVYKWEYQSGQYIYISFDDMATLPGWFRRVPGGASRDKRTFLCIDEATDLFDNLDRCKLNNDSVYRELFRFLRLSRHAHIDVLFICQDLNAINSRLRGLVGCIWRSTDMSNFRLGGLKIAVPVNCFLLQQFDRTGKMELRREFIAKDRRIFTLYQSEAFHDQLGITFSPPVADGRIRGVKKMSKLERFLLFFLLVLVVYLIVSGRARSRELKRLRLDIQQLTNIVPGNSDSDEPKKTSPEKTVKNKRNSIFDFSVHNEPEEPDSPELPTRKIVRGVFDFVGSNKGDYCYVDGDLYRVGLLTEYGLCKVVSKNSIICVDGLKETIILPCRKSSTGAPSLEASSDSF